MKSEKEIEASAKGEKGFTLDMEGSMKKKIDMPSLPKPLTLDEKRFLLAVERGDTANVRRMVQKAQRKRNVSIDCVDPLGRGAMTLAIDQENLEMLELLVVLGVETKDSLLHAINVGFVEAVELLLEHEELIHKDGEPYSWERVDWNTATFTRDITPLVLAAHRNNYEILKILLDRGATLPMPHDIKCGCNVCLRDSQEDTLRHSQSRVNEYKALASPSLIALSSNDPILTTFELSWELRNLAFAEQESKTQYMELRRQCQQFAVDLLAQSRSSQELAIILNHDPNNTPYEDGEHMKLTRLELAIEYKQKKFVAHPNVQQLLAAIWYEGLPGFRRKPPLKKLLDIVSVALLFPVYSTVYMFMPNTHIGKLMRKPFMKFLIHASSYLFFLMLLILVSQRAEVMVIQLLGTESMRVHLEEQLAVQRGNLPTVLEFIVTFYVFGFIWEETVEIWREGIQKYLRDMWNFIDFTRNSLYVAVIILRLVAYIQQSSEIAEDPATAYIPREMWNDYDPQLIAEGLFAAANVFSALKLVHLFSINPHLGPLQISLGRMVIDIVKFFFIYSLVLFAFACGLNQLLWYFADMERKKCYSLPGGFADWDNKGDSCSKWRSFGNLFESTQSLFWASFGGIGVDHFQLAGIKSYTRFWGLLMFGSYSVINVIVLLNLLIAMMSNSYAIIDEHSDTEWKFARTKLWMSYFEESATLPPPFNVFPTPKLFFKIFGLRKKDKIRRMSTKRKEKQERERDYRYTAVMRALVWRYVAAKQRAQDDAPVTEDDVNELKGEISSMKCQLLNVLEKNGMDVSLADRKEKTVLGKKMKVWERRLMKDFHLSPVAGEEEMDFLMTEPPPDEDPLSKFRRLAKLAVLSSTQQKWGQVVRGVCKASQIGRCNNKVSFKNQQNLQKAMVEARKIAARSPRPESRTCSPSPIKLPDTTGHSLMELLNDFNQETGRSPYRGSGDSDVIALQPDKMSQISPSGLRARSVSPNLRGHAPGPQNGILAIVNDKKLQNSVPPRSQQGKASKNIPRTCITMDEDTITVKTEENTEPDRNKLVSPPPQTGPTLTEPRSRQRSPMRSPPPAPDMSPPKSRDGSPENVNTKPLPLDKSRNKTASAPPPEKKPAPVPAAKSSQSLSAQPKKTLPSRPSSPVRAPPPPVPTESMTQPTPAARSSSSDTVSPKPSAVSDPINSNNPKIKSSSSTEPLITVDSPDTLRSTRLEIPSPKKVDQGKLIKRQPKTGWL